MMDAHPTPIETEALDWLIRQRDPAFAEWEAFSAWLAAAPEHAEAYHALAMIDAEAGEALALPTPKPMPSPVAPRRVGRRAWIGGAMAASLAALVGYAVMPPGSSPYVIETQPGVHRTIALEDGSRIDLNGGTRLALDHKHPRQARLERGEALFTVVHDEARPFTVTVGDATLVDVGTAFNVVRHRDLTSVAVIEGAVIYNPDAEAVRLDPGKALRVRDGDTQLVVAQVDTGGIAAWREGQLVYDGAPIEQVAADLSRNLGLHVEAAPEVAARPFRGVIALGRDGDQVLQRVGPLLDVQVQRVQQGWLLTTKRP